MANLFEKIASVEIDPFERISAEDKEFVERTAKLFKDCCSQLISWRECLLKTEQELGTNPYFLLKKHELGARHNSVRDRYYHRVDKDFDGSRAPRTAVSELLFTPAYALLYIEETLDTLILKRNSEIISHFNSTYNLSLRLEENDCYRTEDVYTLLEKVIALNGGIPFSDTGRGNVIERFSANFRNGELKGDKITFPVVWLGSFSREYDHWGVKVKALTEAVELYESGDLKAGNVSGGFFLRELHPGALIEANDPFFKKFKGFRFYKNHRCDLYFRNGQAAEEFALMFNLPTKQL
jgi:hypothetical protein